MTNSKQIVFDHTARKKLLNGIEKTIASYLLPEQITITDPFEKMGASFAKNLANTLQKECKSHLFSGLILFQELVREGIKQIHLGAHPSYLKSGIRKGVQMLIRYIDESSVSFQVERVLDILSLFQDPDMQNLFKTLYEQKALFSPILFEKGSKNCVTIRKGLHLPYGYASDGYHLNSATVQMKSPSILILNNPISSIYELLPIFKSIPSCDLLILAKSIEKDVLSTLVLNHLYQHVNISIVLDPNLTHHFPTIQSFTKAIPLKAGCFLGRLDKSFIEQDQTILINEKATGDPIFFVSLSSCCKEQIKNDLFFIKQAIESHLVPGYGHCLVFAEQALDQIKVSRQEQGGFSVLKRGCTAFFRHIVQSFGKDPKILLKTIYQKKSPYGFHPISQTIEHLENANILEPALFVKTGLIHASQSAEMVLQSEALIADDV